MALATSATISAEKSMPVFTVSAPMSARTASICEATKSVGQGWMPLTPRVFWAVRAVIALAP